MREQVNKSQWPSEYYLDTDHAYCHGFVPHLPGFELSFIWNGHMIASLSACVDGHVADPLRQRLSKKSAFPWKRTGVGATPPRQRFCTHQRWIHEVTPSRKLSSSDWFTVMWMLLGRPKVMIVKVSRIKPRALKNLITVSTDVLTFSDYWMERLRLCWHWPQGKGRKTLELIGLE